VILPGTVVSYCSSTCYLPHLCQWLNHGSLWGCWPPFKTVVHPNKSKRLKAMPESKNLIEWTNSLMIRVYFLPLQTNTKFNPITCMWSFFTELLKHEPSLTIATLNNKAQLALATNQIPTNKDDFKKFFKILTDTCATTKKQHVIVVCNLLSDQTIQEIKFDTKQPKIGWQKKNLCWIRLPWCWQDNDDWLFDETPSPTSQTGRSSRTSSTWHSKMLFLMPT